MTIRDSIQSAVRCGDAKECVRIAERLRLLGLRYHEIAAIAKRCADIDLADWEALLAEGDE